MAATIKDSYPGLYSITSSIEEGNLGPAYDRCGSDKLGHSPYVGSMSGFAFLTVRKCSMQVAASASAMSFLDSTTF
jgi:hypothetical protein